MMKSTLALLLGIILSASLSAQEKINWIKIEDLEAAQAAEPRKVFIDMYTNWCSWCHKMDKATFQHPGIVKYINEHYYAVKFNAERKDTVHYRGESYAFIQNGRRGYNQLAALLMNGQLSYPTIVYLDEDLRIIQPVQGYMSPQDFERTVTYLAGDHYKEQPFEQYKKNYTLIHTAKKED